MSRAVTGSSTRRLQHQCPAMNNTGNHGLAGVSGTELQCHLSGEDANEVLLGVGINVLGSFCVEIEGTNGSKGFATGFGGPPACWLVAEHFRRFLVGAGEDPRLSL